MEEPQIQYPIFLNVGTKASWTAKNKQANELLGYACDGADNYSNPIIDVDSKYWFIINPEVLPIITEAELAKAVSYDSIVLPENKL